MGKTAVRVLSSIFLAIGITGLLLLLLFCYIPYINTSRFFWNLFDWYLLSFYGPFDLYWLWEIELLPNFYVGDLMYLGLWLFGKPLTNINIWNIATVDIIWVLIFLISCLALSLILLLSTLEDTKEHHIPSKEREEIDELKALILAE